MFSHVSGRLQTRLHLPSHYYSVQLLTSEVSLGIEPRADVAGSKTHVSLSSDGHLSASSTNDDQVRVIFYSAALSVSESVK